MIQEHKMSWLTHGLMTFLIAGLTLLTFGCAGPKENTALKNARDAYMQAKANPSVEANGAVALYEAGKILTRAEHAEDNVKMTHLAYMAQKQTAIAVAIAEQKVADAERQQLAGDTNKILVRQKDLQARAAMAKSKQLEEELNALKAKKTDRGFVLTLGDVLFATGKANLMPGAQRTIDQLAAFLNKYPNKSVSVEGHTDSRGSDSYNMVLSQSRADSVRSAIMARGISYNRITTKGLGEMYPVASNLYIYIYNRGHSYEDSPGSFPESASNKHMHPFLAKSLAPLSALQHLYFASNSYAAPTCNSCRLQKCAVDCLPDHC